MLNMTEMTLPFLVHRFTKYLYGFGHQSGPDFNLHAICPRWAAHLCSQYIKYVR